MSRAHELDLVRANQGLTFPQNVELQFVYWEHTQDNLRNIVPHLQTADAIASEVAKVSAPDGFTPATAGKALEKATNHMVQGIATEDQVRFVRRFGSFTRAEIATYVGLPQKPRVFFVDDFRNVTDEKMATSARAFSHKLEEGEAYIGDNLCYAEWDFEREHVALGQIASIATRLGRGNTEKRLAILYGSRHTHLSVAARTLGGNVTRTFVDRPSVGVLDVVINMMRYDLLPPYDEISDEQRSIILDALAIDGALINERADTGPLRNPGTLLRAVADIDPAIRAELANRAGVINQHRKDKILESRIKSRLGRLLLHLPSNARMAVASVALQDDFERAVKQQQLRSQSAA